LTILYKLDELGVNVEKKGILEICTYLRILIEKDSIAIKAKYCVWLFMRKVHERDSDDARYFQVPL